MPVGPLDDLGLLRRFAQCDGELRLAGLGRVVEGAAGPVALRRLKEKSVLQISRQAGEARFPVDVGADFEIELVGAHKSVGDAGCDLSVVERLVVGAGDGEVGGTIAEAGIDRGDGVRVGAGRLRKASQSGAAEECGR